MNKIILILFLIIEFLSLIFLYNYSIYNIARHENICRKKATKIFWKMIFRKD